MLRGELNQKDAENTVQKIFEDFKLFLTHEKQLSYNSISAYCFDVKNFLKFLSLYKNKKLSIRGRKNQDGNLCGKVEMGDLESCDVDVFRDWIYYRVENSLSSRSNARAISAMRVFYDFLGQNCAICNQEILKLSKPKVSKLLPKIITKEMFLQFCDGIDATSKKTWHSLRDKSVALLMFTSGVRVSEALSLKLSDVNNERDFLHIIGKGQKERIVPYLEQVRKIVDEYILQVPFELKNGYLFLSNAGEKYSSRLVQRVFEKSRRVANLPEHVTPHKLRHSCATILLENSKDENALKKIKDLLGHSNLATTEIYTRVSTKMITNALTDIKYWNS